MNKWDFNDSVTITINVLSKVRTKVLGQYLWVPYLSGTIKIFNVNMALYSGGDQVLLFSKANEPISIDIKNLPEEDISLFRSKTMYENHGLIEYVGGTKPKNYVKYVGLNGNDPSVPITNGFFDANTLAGKAKEKKVLIGESDVSTIYNMTLVFDGKPLTGGSEQWATFFTMESPSGLFAYWVNSPFNGKEKPGVKCLYEPPNNFDELSKSYVNKIANKTEFDAYDLIANKVYDSENALSLVTVDVYQYNGLMTLNFSSGTEGEYIEERVQAFGALRWNDLQTKTSAEIAKEGSLYSSRSFGMAITFSQDSINDVMGFPVGVIAVSCNSIGSSVEDYAGFAGYGLIKIMSGMVSDANYNLFHTNIKLVIHEDGELPPSMKSDDDKNDDNSVRGDDPPSGNTPSDTSEIGVNLLTTTYLLTKAQLNSLGNELWSDNFMKNVLLLSSSPIENILSCKIFPTTFSGVAAALKVGNVTMLNGASVQKISATGLSKDTGAITFPQLYNSFLDFEPFTQARILIPFVGFQPLPVANFIGAQISLRYVFDVVTGAVSVYLLRNGYIFDKYSGICAVDVPLTASNRAQVEVGQIQSAITGVTQLATGNIGGALSSGLAIASTPNHFNTRGNAGGYTSQFDPRQPYLIIDRPKAQSEITSYGETNGFPCNLTKTLSTLKGFTSVHDVHLDDVPCLESERQELKAIMQKGFII